MPIDTAEEVRTYLATLEELRPGRSKSYFEGLHLEVPGAMAATVRNIEYGLSQFAPGLVVDLGCGHGLQAYAFARHGREVLGTDINEYRMKWATEAMAKLGVENATFEVADTMVALEGRKAGAIFLHRAIHHLPDLPAFFASAHRALAPGGTMVIVTSNARSRELLRWIPFIRPGRHKVADMTTQITDAGFVMERMVYHGYLTSLPLKWRIPFTAEIDRFLAKVPGIRALGGSFTLTARAI